MRLFIDSGNIDDIAYALRTGAVSGITTNPTLLTKSMGDASIIDIANQIVELIKGVAANHPAADATFPDNKIPLSIELITDQTATADDMQRQAKLLRSAIPYHGLNIKVPIIGTGHELRVIRLLASRGFMINCTCCYTTGQLVMAANAGAKFVSLFYNRLLDMGGDPIRVISETRKILDMNRSNALIIVGSIRKSDDVVAAWAAGAHIVTASRQILDDLLQHEGSRLSFEKFVNDSKNLKLQSTQAKKA